MIPVSVCHSVSLSVCLYVTRLNSALLYKMAEQIKMLFGVNTPGGPRNIVLDGGPDPPQRGDSMQPSPNYFSLLLLVIPYTFTSQMH